ncbi:MAG: lamin tail domain-containing protein [Fidelibacterota bacterium]
MKKHLLKSFLLAFTVVATLQAQSFSGSYQMTGVHVGYTNVARAPESPEDSIANYLVEAHWPSAATSLFSAPLAGFAPGDTIVLVETPDYLLTPFGLAAAGIDLSLALNQEDGNMLIPGVEGTSSTYPTTDTENCSTFLSIAPVSDNADIEFTTTSNSYNQTDGTFTWGFGISQSTVFDWFSAPADWENPGKNNGILTGYFNSDESEFDILEVNWLAEDGQDTDSGIDDNGLRNRHLGITVVPGDTVTVAALNAALGSPFNVGTYPILGGEGVDLDADGELDGVVDTDWGYYFDPSGDDGVLLSGDEPFQFTGYYMTYNLLSAVGLFEGLFEATYAATGDLEASFILAADSTLETFGAPTTSNLVVTSLADSLATWIAAGVAAYMAEGLSLEEATAQATEDALQAGLMQGIGGTALLPTLATDLFFSEYAEGSSNNKYVEIYNGTGADVDLSSYSVQGTNNGTAWGDGGDRDVTLAGTLIAGDVYILAADAADSLILAQADTALAYESPMHHNGDDGIALLKDGTIIDVIGVENNDPGSGWDVAGVTEATKDHVLVRKSTVTSGNTDWTASAGTDSISSEWLVLAKDTWTELGQHTYLASGWAFPDDSDHDYDGVNGRLVFQIGNSCVPNLQTRDVYAIFSKINLGIESEGNIPLEFAVHENYPNPFNPTTKIRIDLPEASPTEVTVWNMLGQKVATLYAGDLPAGRHSITFNARNDNGIMLPSGVYIYRVESGSHITTNKMMLLK